MMGALRDRMLVDLQSSLPLCTMRIREKVLENLREDEIDRVLDLLRRKLGNRLFLDHIKIAFENPVLFFYAKLKDEVD